MNCVAFSVYGTDQKYLVGSVENARTCNDFYPGWQAHFWVSTDLPGIAEQLRREGAIVHDGPSEIANGMFWRFLVHDLPGVDRYIVRDVDSRLSIRETKAVQEWMLAGTQLHILRDHPYHNQTIMGGSFGWVKQQEELKIGVWARGWCQDKRRGQDQDFLYHVLFKKASSNTIHDSCGTFDGTHNWPPDGEAFFGEYIYADGTHNQEHRKIRLDHLSKLKCYK